MRKIFIAVSLFFCIAGYSQNAYYDMLQLTRWSRLQDTSSEKRNRAEAMLVKLLKYTGGSSFQLRNDNSDYRNIKPIYLKADTLYSFKKRYEIPKPNVLYTVTHTRLNSRDTNLRTLDTLVWLYRTNSADTAKLRRGKHNYETKKSRVNASTLSDFKNSLVYLADTFLLRFPGQSGINRQQYDNLFRSIDWDGLASGGATNFEAHFKTNFAALDTTFAEWINNLLISQERRIEEIEEAIYQTTMLLPPQTFRNLFPQLNLQAEEVINRSDRDFEALKAKAGIEEMKYAAAASAGGSGQLTDLNFPTQSEIIDAIALYLARRTKQEAALFLIESLGKALKSDDLARDLFPHTAKVMLNQEVYESPKFGAKWRNAIATDYISLPENIINSSFIKKRFDSTAGRMYFADAVTFAGYIAKKYSFVDVLRTLFSDTSKLHGRWTRIGVNVLHIIDQELYDTSERRYWIPPQNLFALDTMEMLCLYDLIRMKYKNKVCQPLRTLFNDPEKFKSNVVKAGMFYTELLTVLQQFYAAQTTPLKSPDGTTVVRDGFWDTQRNLVDLVLNQGFVPLTPKERQALTLCKKGFFVYDYISNKNYIAAAENVLEIIEGLTGRTPKTLINLTQKEMMALAAGNKDLSREMQSANDLFSGLLLLYSIRDSLEFTALPSIDSQYIPDRFDLSATQMVWMKSIFPATRYTLDAFEAILQEAIKKQADTVNKKFNEFLNHYKRLQKTKTKTIPTIKNGKFLYRDATDLTEGLKNVSHTLSLQNTSYFKWLTNFSELLTEIALSTDNESLANVIESHALPTGSYRQKRNSLFSIDLNAYVGGYYGQEKIKGQNSFQGVYGLTAPVGISFSLGRTKKKKTNEETEGSYLNKKGIVKHRTQHSWTLDFTIIDIGAVVSYRLGSGSEKGLPKNVRWSQVLSPGFNIRYGLKGTPLCFGIGYQYSPELRTFDKEQKDARRIHFTVAFDLPLINFYRSR